MLTQRWNQAEADFQRFYSLDLRSEVEAEPPRRLFALIENLPPEAALWREDAPFVTTNTADLLALIAEEIGRWNFLLLQALSGRRPHDLESRGAKRIELRKGQKIEITTDRDAIARFFGRARGSAPKRAAAKRGGRQAPTKPGQTKTPSKPRGR